MQVDRHFVEARVCRNFKLESPYTTVFYRPNGKVMYDNVDDLGHNVRFMAGTKKRWYANPYDVVRVEVHVPEHEDYPPIVHTALGLLADGEPHYIHDELGIEPFGLFAGLAVIDWMETLASSGYVEDVGEERIAWKLTNKGMQRFFAFLCRK